MIGISMSNCNMVFLFFFNFRSHKSKFIRQSNGRPSVFALFSQLSLFSFFVPYFSPESRQWTKTKMGIKVDMEKIEATFQQVLLGESLRGGAFDHIYNGWLGESAGVDEDDRIYHAWWLDVGPCPKFLVYYCYCCYQL